MLRGNRIKEYVFNVGSLTANADGLFNVFSENSINGEILALSTFDNTFEDTGSIIVFLSGLNNSGTNLGGQITRFRAGSRNLEFNAPISTGLGFVTNQPLRLVGSGLGANTSGLSFIVKYQ